ncbi:bifunctional epoxide hydrolase 2-like isoform X5 [Micropterus salmoides]|uniref:bifunctional epoxide hydrolase 2-like isoform X4 n=1 Tax=Micropterus salmoides TaxID=27706 RepID=UPI0018EC419B|nr:bifunctional epoxide hydrolase 2-like isoform X4 [Micropterus salmoides]XP_038573110.1 bifunctional epoxide hydrolase 2-like isoform X5 [Micropterus salmoides]XP_038573575.1 bifunctional epoxide hydrolase 2-like isoform X5 [Micropterus salmoides]
MAERKAVLFNFWGVAVSSSPRDVFRRLEELHHLPGGFLSAVASRRDSAMSRAERGEVTLSQMIAAFEAECVKEAQVRGVTLPSDWSVRGLLEELREAMMDVQPAVLKAAAGLRHRGLLTAVLANHWLDDSAAGDGPARLLSLLGGHFDQVLQSCRSGHRVPESSAFSSALRHLGVTSQQALWLDADEEGVKAAEGAGMKAVLVENLADALDKLADFTGVQAAGAESPPPSCSPDEVSHGYVTIGPGVRTHYVEMGSGPPVLLCHGFPESWYSWRYQIPAVAAAGFRVLALDMKGYGESTAPPDTEEYSQEQLCQDLITFLDKMGAAEAELEKDLERTFKIFFFSSGEAAKRPAVSTAGVCARGGLFVGLPEQIPRSSVLTEADLQYYVSQYRERGFRWLKTGHGICSQAANIFIQSRSPSCVWFHRRPLNWYRNGEANWRWMCSRPTAKLLMPALMVTAGKDQVLLPAFSKGMEDLIPNLSRGHIEECGHWTQMERPAETNSILISWLRETHKKAGGVKVAPKL